MGFTKPIEQVTINFTNILYEGLETMIMLLFKIFIGMLLFFGILCIFSVIFTFFTAAWESVKEDEENGLLDFSKSKKKKHKVKR